MKKCIWCLKTEGNVSFTKRAHTVPKSMGGVKICEEVCDDCNAYFGSTPNRVPGIEVALKELFNISRHIILNNINETKKLRRYKSEYFNINWNLRRIKVKPRYKVYHSFQEKLGRQLKRGIYKVFLEERSRIVGDTHDRKYDFIRRFSRYDLDDQPLYYFVPGKDILPFSLPDINQPELIFSDYHVNTMREFGFYEFYFVGHYLSIPVISNHHIMWESYKRHIKKEHSKLFASLVEIRKFNEIDYTFSYLNPI